MIRAANLVDDSLTGRRQAVGAVRPAMFAPGALGVRPYAGPSRRYIPAIRQAGIARARAPGGLCGPRCTSSLTRRRVISGNRGGNRWNHAAAMTVYCGRQSRKGGRQIRNAIRADMVQHAVASPGKQNGSAMLWCGVAVLEPANKRQERVNFCYGVFSGHRGHCHSPEGGGFSSSVAASCCHVRVSLCSDDLNIANHRAVVNRQQWNIAA